MLKPVSLPPVRPFGSVLTAMVTPFTAAGDLDLPGVAAVARHLVETGCDGLVVHGTTGESPTTTLAEKRDVLDEVRRTVGPDVPLVVGVGGNNTAHDLQVMAALKDGADGFLIVTPYYNKPTQAGLLHHFTTLADASDLPVMLYDIPGRCGVPIQSATMIELAKHPRIVANKDAKADFVEAARVMAATDLAWYSGDDPLNLLHLAHGACGVVSVTGHVAAQRHRQMVAALDAGDLGTAIAIHHDLIGLTDVMMGLVPGAVSAKCALHHLGIIGSDMVRSPLVTADEATREKIKAAVNP